MLRMGATVLCAAMMLAPYSATASQAADPSGTWDRDDGNARVRIAPCGERVCATNIWIGDTSRGEEVGDRLVMSLEPKSANQLAGTAYDEKRDMTYSITVTVNGESLTTRGCIVGGLLCRNVRWRAAR